MSDSRRTSQSGSMFSAKLSQASPASTPSSSKKKKREKKPKKDKREGMASISIPGLILLSIQS